MKDQPKPEVNMRNIAAFISVISFLTIFLSFFLKFFIVTSYNDRGNRAVAGEVSRMMDQPKPEVNMQNIAAFISVISFLTIFLSFFLKFFIVTSYVDELNMRFFEPYLMNSGNYVVLSAAAIIFFFSLPVFSGAGSAIWTLNYADQKNNSQPSSSSPSYSKIIFYGIILISFSFCFTFFFYFGYVFLSLLFCLASIPVIAFWFSGVNLAELLLPDFAVLNRLCVYCDLKANQPDIKNVDTDRNDSMKSRKTWSDVCSISPAYLQIVAILVPFIFIRGSRA